MGKTDEATRAYLSDVRVFADAFNSRIFHGQQRVKPENLQPVDTSLLLDLWGKSGQDGHFGKESRGNGKRGSNQYAQRYRDLFNGVQLYDDGEATYVLLGIEAQTNVHYAMPIKSMVLDGLSYAAQVNHLRDLHRLEGDTSTSAEFLSGMHRKDRITPVITLVIYFGVEPWDGPMKLSDMMDIKGDLAEYVQDYKIVLIDPHSMEEDEYEKFQSDLGLVMRFLHMAQDKTNMKQLIKDEQYAKVDRRAAQVMTSCAGIDVEFAETEETVDMCKAWDEIMKDERSEGKVEGRMEGIAEGRAEGKAEGRTEGRREGMFIFIEDKVEDGVEPDTIKEKLMRRFHLSEVEAQSALEQCMAAAK